MSDLPRVEATLEIGDLDDWEARAVRGGAIVLGSQVAQFAIGLASTVVLARLLTPADFGVVAMAGIVVGVLLNLKDFGLGLAIPQYEGVEHADLSELFWWSLAYTTGLTVLCAAAGPGLAWFFHEPLLIPITAWLAVALWLSGLVNIPIGLLRRQMRFGALSLVNVGATLCGVSVAIGLALTGWGLWSLVAQQFVHLSVHALAIALIAGFRPARTNRKDARPAPAALKRFGGETTAVRAFNEIADQLDRILVGRLAGASVLGLYQMSHRWSTLPALQLLVPLKGVAVTAFSRLRDDPPRYRAATREAFTAVLSLVLPVLAYLLADAHVVIPTLLGSAWSEAIPIFRLLALAAFLGCASRLMIWVYLAEGRTSDRLRFTLIARPISMLLVAAGAPYGAIGIATGYAVGRGVVAVANVVHACANSPLRAGDFTAAAARPVCAALLAAGVVALAGAESSGVIHLLSNGAIFSLSYIACWLAIPGGLPRARRSFAWLRTGR